MAGCALLGWGANAAAQEERVDSAQMRIRERLERLARPIGYDSVLYVQDSIRVAEAAQGNRPAGAGMDSVATQLLAIPGYTLTEYEAESADFQAARRVLVLQAPESGRARVSREGLVFEADTSITFDDATGRISNVGDATFTPPQGEAVDAANMVYDLGEARGSAFDARTSVDQSGANWLVRGEMPYAAQDSTFMSHGQFTSCDIEEPHYHFEADEVKIVGGNVLVARDVRLYFADVPVAWLPFMAQSLDQERASGLLTPRFSVNDIVRSSSGYRRRISNVGFYWAMSQYSDALVAMDWFSESFISVTSSLRYRFARQFLDGDVNVRQFWREDGSTELALDTRHSWEIDERTQLRASARYVENNDFVREFSFNPVEVTQSIDSEAGLNRRFDWGSVSVSSSRRQYLSDDRTEWLLPSANVSLSPITLFRAPSAEAHFYNNLTWSGSSGFRRNTFDRVQPDTFALAQANTAKMSSFARSNLSIGNLTFSQSVDLSESETFRVPEALLVLGDSADPADLVTGAPVRDISESTLGWSASVNYQQQLIGSTTLTPRLSLSGNLFRSDTDSLAQSFVSAPSRISFGAQLKTDIYGFFPGFGSFEAIRHKVSPSFDYQWSPESTPTTLQRSVFGSRALQPRNIISLSLNQTFEAKRASDDQTESGPLPTDSAAAAQADLLDPLGEPRRIQQAQVVTLMALRTSVIEYDFVQADSVSSFLGGFTRTRLSNQISSDYLRGLSVSMDHDLFEDVVGDDGSLERRSFKPHLSQVNLSFSVGSSSAIFRWLRFGGGGDEDEPPPEEPEATDLLELGGPTDESAVVPVSGREPVARAPTRGGTGGWSANLSYSLQRPRDPMAISNQMLSGTVRFEPTEKWSMSWRTAYDLEARSFNDHSIRLTRDLHRWQANFDFLQTATGNWSFRFEVSLMDNRDLKFDYRQRNLDLGLPSSQR
jgi:hypothetical protein